VFDIVGKRKWFFLFSALLIVPGLVFLLLGGLKLGIDFTGGSLWDVQFTHPTKPLVPQEVRDVLATQGYGDAAVQTASGNAILIRTHELKEGSPQKAALTAALEAVYGPIDQQASQLQTVGPSVGTSISQRAVVAIIFTSIGILLYIAYAFRRAQHPFRFGTCAILAMLHDVLIVLGFFAFLGYFFSVEIDSLFVTALLTVIGFSVHDTIVVFDRIRENMIVSQRLSFEQIVNLSIMQTAARSIITSFTVVLVLGALFLFGGDTLKGFSLALLIGVISGTYSSIFNAAPLLVVWRRIVGGGYRAARA
jgi:preprotein translocase subunit SecF